MARLSELPNDGGSKRLRQLVAVAIGPVTLSLMTSPAWAQKPASLPGEDDGWLQIGIALGIAVVVCLPAFLNPKRSHLS